MSTTHRDYYEVLGVSRTADQRQIKRAFLQKARVMHPDVSDDPDAEAKFKEINEAYGVLSDERRRANYDRYGDPDGPGGAGGFPMDDFFGGFDMGDLFSDFFGGAATRQRAQTRGRDMAMTLRISLADAASGISRTVSYDRMAPCEDCDGTGAAHGSVPITCPTCHGTGSVVTVQRTILGDMRTQTTCPECHGTGEVVDQACETCDGQGRTPSREQVTIDVPAGVASGARIVLEAMGEAGIRGDRPGDLVVTIEVAPDPVFQRSGDDLGRRETIDVFEAALGASFEIDGILEGERVLVEVPAGTQPGDHVVVAGHGMPRMGREGRGDLVVLLDVHVPTDLTEADREVLGTMGERHHSRLTSVLPTPGPGEAPQGDGSLAPREGDQAADDPEPDRDRSQERPRAKGRPRKKGRLGRRGRRR